MSLVLIRLNLSHANVFCAEMLIFAKCVLLFKCNISVHIISFKASNKLLCLIMNCRKSYWCQLSNIAQAEQ